MPYCVRGDGLVMVFTLLPNFISQYEHGLLTSVYLQTKCHSLIRPLIICWVSLILHWSNPSTPGCSFEDPLTSVTFLCLCHDTHHDWNKVNTSGPRISAFCTDQTLGTIFLLFLFCCDWP